MNPKKLARKVIPNRGIRVAEEAYRRGRVYALQGRYGFPAKDMRIIAVTGTNGKTTTCIFINEILKNAGYRTALITTAVMEIAGKSVANRTHRTVPVTSELLQLLREAKSKKVDFIVLEVTSQALHQHKLVGLPIEVAVMTNLTQDHLDYHGNMQSYAEAKARLFDGYCDPKFVVLNRDDEWYQHFEDRSTGQELSYGKNPDSTLRITSVKSTQNNNEVSVSYGDKKQTIRLQLIGEFNAYNAVAAIAASLSVGVSFDDASKGVEKLTLVPGRMEKIELGQNFDVYVDFAITPDALEKALKALRKTTAGKVAVVFGATGDRDKTKRPIMGSIAAKNADLVYLTDDETYSEDPDTIRDAVNKGIIDAGGKAKTTVVPDRLEAIKTAFKYAKKGDAVLLTGLGHEDYRNMGGKKVKWDEREVARRLLKKLK